MDVLDLVDVELKYNGKYFEFVCKLNENTWKAIDLKAHNDIIQVDTTDSFIIDENYKTERKDSNPEDKTIEMTATN